MIDMFYLASIARRALLLCSLLITSCCDLLAQTGGPPGPPPSSQSEAERGPGVDRAVNQLTQWLTLTDAQQSQVRALLTDQKRRIDELRQSMQSELSKSDATREKMDEIRDRTDTKIAALLDESQKVKFAAWQEQRRTAMERRHQQHGNEPSPASSDSGGAPPPGV